MNIYKYLNKKYLNKKLIITGIILAEILVLSLGAFGGYKYHQYLSERQENKYAAFVGEVYTIIQENYWQKAPDEELSKLFEQAVKQVGGRPYLLPEKNKEGVKDIIVRAIENRQEEEKENFVVEVCNLVLQSLQPQGRSALYTQKQTEKLIQQVHNIQPDEDLYEILGVDKTADSEEIEKAYEEKMEEVREGKIPEEQAQAIKKAKNILSDPLAREEYNKTGVQSTVFGEILTPEIFYLKITRFTPLTFQEFQRVVNEADQKAEAEMNTLILDLRDNIGGAVDLLPQFLGPFIGPNQYAYQFFHQGEYEPFKTTTGWLPSLVRYKKVIILVNGGTQSSAELAVSTLKKYNVGVVVGTPTRGWGTIERIFDLENQINSDKVYSLLLVHSITLREDGEPIEGRGVNPVIDVREAGWKEELFAYFNSEKLIQKVEEVWKNPPL